jgi:predicted thioesterase
MGPPGLPMVTLAFSVTEQDTASALGSGDVDVLATPRLIAWCECATLRAAAGQVLEHETSVGSQVSLEHLISTPVGGMVEVVASLAAAEGRFLRFTVTASDRAGRLVATGEVTRVIVHRERFAARVPPA